MIIQPYLNFVETINTTTLYGPYDVSEFNFLRFALKSSSTSVFSFRWSIDGLTGDFADSYTVPGLGSQVGHIPVRAKFLTIEVNPNIPPDTIHFQILFNTEC